MSASESGSPKKTDLEEEIDDLFGGEDDQVAPLDEDDDDGAADSNDEANNVKDEDEAESEDDEATEKNLRTLDIALSRHALSFEPEDDTYLIKLPVFLNVEAHPFDPNEFKERVANAATERLKLTLDAKAIQNDLIAEKLLNENTIRWRYSNSGDDEIIKQSNAHFIQWDDGLLSVKIGKEIFDFRALPLTDNFLAKSHVENEILQNDLVLTKSASLLPSSTATDTHRKLTQAVKNIQKKDKILNTLTEGDPMMKQRMADENERKTMKMRRQLEHKRRLQEERLGKTDSPNPGSRSAYERFERNYGRDEYDDDDDDDLDAMIDDGDEEESEEIDAEQEEEEFEKGAERLKNLKHEGQLRYSSPAGDDAEERRKRRRIIDSDDEE